VAKEETKEAEMGNNSKVVIMEVSNTVFLIAYVEVYQC
jgi:flagellar biogenesis protein FliO